MTLQQFIGTKVKYDPEGQMIFSVYPDNTLQLILDVRGWGAIQNLPVENPAAFQDELGEWIADAINQKINQSHH